MSRGTGTAVDTADARTKRDSHERTDQKPDNCWRWNRRLARRSNDKRFPKRDERCGSAERHADLITTIPTVGVGEATTLSMGWTLDLAGLDENDFIRSCDVTFKAAVKFTAGTVTMTARRSAITTRFPYRLISTVTRRHIIATGATRAVAADHSLTQCLDHARFSMR